MLTTTEMRWFKQGNLPTAVLHWFEQDYLGGQLESAAARDDVYLCLDQANVQLGIKLRQGRLEIKWRQAELGIWQFGQQVQGKAEVWGKWLCEDPTSNYFQPATVVEKNSWVSVHKVRSQRFYRVVPDASVIAVPSTESPSQGCSIEITQLSIKGSAWWSLAFEAFGDEALLTVNLQAVANWVFSTNTSDLKLLAQDSYAYPSWLSLAV